MKRFNAGDVSGPPIPELTGNARCWRGVTSNICSIDSSKNLGFTYLGCTRTLCNYYAAKQICAAIGWRLPADIELNVLKILINTEGTNNVENNLQKYNPNGLQLCNYSSSLTAPRCDSYQGACAPADSLNWCDPSDVTGESANGAAAYSMRYENDKVTLLFSDTAFNASSVRCVLTVN